MTLAKDLLEKGERDVVLEYFMLCRKFWKWTTANWISDLRSHGRKDSRFRRKPALLNQSVGFASSGWRKFSTSERKIHNHPSAHCSTREPKFRDAMVCRLI